MTNSPDNSKAQTVMEQIIDESGELSPCLDDYFKKLGIFNAGLEYHIVSIIGCQSSGKSTLLNLLFGTTFQTMNDQIGRQQTTKGIHAARSRNSPLLIYDVEGSDSRERGDADSLFERKSALFALALSDVLIINMWETDIGRYHAANLPMLKTVFEVNIQLFLTPNQPKSKIVFVIRDFTGHSFDEVCRQLNNDMNNVWSEIKLPPQFVGKSITDFFDFEYFAIHHMNIQKAEFDKDIDTLRRWFEDPSSAQYLFKSNRQTTIPGDGLTHYITSMWDTISENKELNIPSQKLMLSIFKCEENSKAALEKAVSELKEITAPISDGKPLVDFKGKCQPIIDQAIEQYTTSSWRYTSSVVEEKKKALISNLSAFMFPFYLSNNNLVSSIKISEYSSYIESLGNSFIKGGTWLTTALTKADALIESVKDEASKSSLSPFNWSFDEKEFSNKLIEIEVAKRDRLVADLHSNVIENRLKEYEDKANELIKDSEPNMWEKLRELTRSSADSTKSEISEILSTNVPAIQPDAKILEKFQEKGLSIVEDSVKFILLKMKSAFDKHFKLEANGRPRVWKDGDDVNQIYEESRLAAISVLRLFQFCKLREPGTASIANDPLGKILIEKDAFDQAMEQFDRLGMHAYNGAKLMIQAQVTNKETPAWAWFLLLAVGWDKIGKLAANPAIFFLILFVGGTYFLLKQLGLTQVLLEKLKEKLSNALNNEEGKTDVKTEKEESPAESSPSSENSTENGVDIGGAVVRRQKRHPSKSSTQIIEK